MFLGQKLLCGHTSYIILRDAICDISDLRNNSGCINTINDKKKTFSPAMPQGLLGLITRFSMLDDLTGI